MPTQELNLMVICGLPTTGKTALTQALKKCFIGSQFRFIAMDEVREETWGSKKRLTDTEHVYKNRIAERVAQNAFIVEGATYVVYDAVMLTREEDEKPLMKMVQVTEDWLSKIHEEKVGSPVDVEIRVKCIWLTCPPEVIKERLEARFADPQGLHSVKMDAWYDLQRRFEDITEFPYRKFDTSIISLPDLVREAIKYIEE